MFRCDICDHQLDEQAMLAGIYAPEFETARGLNAHKMRTHREWAAAQRRAKEKQKEMLKAQRETDKEEARRQAIRDLQKPDDVKNVKDVIVFAINRLGCDWPEGQDWKRCNIILSYSGYEVRELAETIEWCANTGKRFDLPWKVIIWVDHWKEQRSRVQSNALTDPIQQRLDSAYVAADREMQKRIRAVSYQLDKRGALALLQELER